MSIYNNKKIFKKNNENYMTNIELEQNNEIGLI